MAKKGLLRKTRIDGEIHHLFTQLIKSQRDKKGYSLRQLAKATGVSHTYLSDIEKGKFAVSLDVGLAICEVLDIDIEVCIHYIYEIEHERLVKHIEEVCDEWYDKIPMEKRLHLAGRVLTLSFPSEEAEQKIVSATAVTI